MTVVLLLLLRARADVPPPALAEVGVDARIGATLDPSLPFVDQDGRPVRLGDAFDGARPVVLALAWYRCTMVCGLLLAGLADAARQSGPDAGFLSVSYDARDTVADAAEARRRASARLPGVEWGFWTGTDASIETLTLSLGIRTARDRRTGEISHPVVAFVLSPRGVVSSVLYGPSFDPGELGAAITAARTTAFPPRTEPVICAKPESPPPVYRAWLRAAGLLGVTVAAGTILLFKRGGS